MTPYRLLPVLRYIFLAALLAAGAGADALAANAVPGASQAGDTAARGEYLARIGNCAGCHTAPGGEPFSGGRALETELGTFYTPNITADADTGIGGWSRDDLWAALHRGQRPDGTSLYPACPYPSLTWVSRDDVEALHAFLQTRPAVARETPEHDLDFPFGFRWLLPVWKTLYFQAGNHAPDPERSDAWNRGRYLVRGLVHCNECHRERNFMGAVRDTAHAGGAMVHGWYAPSLHHRSGAGLQGMSVAEAAEFLRTGKSPDAAMMGPMAGVVFESLQYLTPADARAMAAYLTSLPDRDRTGDTTADTTVEPEEKMALGERIYADGCQDCHGENGRGSEGIVALAGNRGVTADNPVNVINMIRRGGFAASVPGHSRPHGMPPYHDLTDREVAAVATYIRRSWGNRASEVSTIDVSGR